MRHILQDINGKRGEEGLVYAEDIEKKCALCQFGQPIPDTLEVLCKKYGVVEYNYVCKKYKYDIFKKKVKRKRDADMGFGEEDFSID